ncbi:MAG: GTPase Era [Rickettsiales bacterium]|jgi:GTP-binding protein Era|nr:GTPase Era [Rickettsiales bacterium]
MKKQKAGFVAVIGPTNAGKSTLINELVGAKVSIVSSKVQTTRTSINGIFNYENSQIVLIDTPGVFTAKSRLERSMVATAYASLGRANAVLLVLDANQTYRKDVDTIIKRIGDINVPVFVAINKVDNIEKSKLLKIAQDLFAKYPFKEVFMISAKKNIGLDELKRALSQILPEQPWFFSADEVSDFPLKLFAAEMVREQIYKNLHQELPYSITVEPEKVEKQDYGYDFNMIIYVLRDTQKKIIIGKNGTMLEKIGASARKELQKELGVKVKLFLFVKAKPDVFEDGEFYENWGMR